MSTGCFGLTRKYSRGTALHRQLRDSLVYSIVPADLRALSGPDRLRRNDGLYIGLTVPLPGRDVLEPRNTMPSTSTSIRRGDRHRS